MVFAFSFQYRSYELECRHFLLPTSYSTSRLYLTNWISSLLPYLWSSSAGWPKATSFSLLSCFILTFQHNCSWNFLSGYLGFFPFYKAMLSSIALPLCPKSSIALNALRTGNDLTSFALGFTILFIEERPVSLLLIVSKITITTPYEGHLFSIYHIARTCNSSCGRLSDSLDVCVMKIAGRWTTSGRRFQRLEEKIEVFI